MDELHRFRSQYKLKENQVLLIPYGSQVYGTAMPKSDEDYFAIVLDDSCVTGEEYLNNNTNIHIYNSNDWQDQLTQHKIHTLEAHFHPDGLSKDYFCFDLDLKILRDSICEKSLYWYEKSFSFFKNIEIWYSNRKIQKNHRFWRGQ